MIDSVPLSAPGYALCSKTAGSARYPFPFASINCGAVCVSASTAEAAPADPALSAFTDHSFPIPTVRAGKRRAGAHPWGWLWERGHRFRQSCPRETSSALLLLGLVLDQPNALSRLPSKALVAIQTAKTNRLCRRHREAPAPCFPASGWLPPTAGNTTSGAATICLGLCVIEWVIFCSPSKEKFLGARNRLMLRRAGTSKNRSCKLKSPDHLRPGP
jgi:hypothetical protein